MNRRPISPAAGRAVLAIAGLLVVATGCRTFSSRQADAVYGPSEGVLETVAVLRRHVSDDTYRFPPATDFSGRNVYRASLLRLEALERAEADALRSGYVTPVILFAKARALERLRAYDLAAGHYREAARLSGELRDEATRSARICARLDAAVGIGLDLLDPLGERAREPLPTAPERVITDLDERVNQLSILEAEQTDAHYRFIAREEIERADRSRAGYFVAMRHALPDGTVRALQELQRVTTRHAASKNRLRHLLRLADFQVELAREYALAVPPESLDFDPAHFRELAEGAIQLYELVGAHDGRPEKIEATRKLEAFLALTLGIDADRFHR